VSDLCARLKKSEHLINELCSSEAELKQANTESQSKIAELKRNVEHFKSMFTCLPDVFSFIVLFANFYSLVIIVVIFWHVFAVYLTPFPVPQIQTNYYEICHT